MQSDAVLVRKYMDLQPIAFTLTRHKTISHCPFALYDSKMSLLWSQKGSEQPEDNCKSVYIQNSGVWWMFFPS